jgi:hypothetical protein
MPPSPTSEQEQRPPPRPPRDWVAIIVTALPGLAALIAVGFTFASVKATQSQVQIAHQEQITAEQGQITDRYNAAITNLGSHSIEVRLGGIYALQRLMQDSPRDQPTVIAVLCAFVRDEAAKPAGPPGTPPPTDVQAALTVVGTRNAANDGPRKVVDFDHAHLAYANLNAANLNDTDLTGTDLAHAMLVFAQLRFDEIGHADLAHANLQGADLRVANLNGANLTGATLTGANLNGASLNGANLTGATLTGATLVGAQIKGVIGLPAGSP